MAFTATGSVFRQIESLFEGSSVAGLTDRQLLERFIARRDPAGEAAFAALVTRHGPMVLDLCLSILGDLHHAEDAFQAVFLVLARRAGSIRDPDLLGNWLYGVAIRTARCAKHQIDRQRQNEEQSAMSRLGSGSSTAVESLAREDMEALHDEIARLPGTFRLPVVLCYFEGLTLDEAARKLRWPAGTLRSRLARARDKLRIGLTRRGVALPAALLTAGLSARSASASVSSSLCDITTRAAIQFAAGQAASPLAASIAQEVLRAMFVNKLRLVATTMLLLVAVATGAGYLSRSLASQDEPKRPPAAPQPQVAATPADATQQRPAPGRMFVIGRVLDPQGKPVPNATTMVHATIKWPAGDQIRQQMSPNAIGQARSEQMSPKAIGQARSDDSGRFQVDAPRTSSSRNHYVGVVALAPGFGVGWAEFDPDVDQPAVDITLRPEQVIQGRLFDLNGRPVPGVEVVLQNMGRVIPADLTIRRPESIDGPWFWWNPRNNFPAWPKPAISDAEGRFTIRGAGRDLRVLLMIDDPRFARQRVPVNTDSTSESKPLTLALEPARIIKGRVTEADTGKPIPHAPVSIRAYTGDIALLIDFEADAEGRFRANSQSADRYHVSASAPERQPYLSVSKLFNWPKGAVEYPIDLALSRGVVIRGKVTEEGSGRSVAGARISFGSRRTPDGNSVAFSGNTASGSDGSFQLAVLPGPGCLVVLGPSDDYVLRVENGDKVQGTTRGRRFYAHAFVACNPKPTDPSLDVNVVLRPGMTVKGRVVGPDGQPIQDAWMISRVFLEPFGGTYLLWRAQHHGSVKGGRFQVHGLDPDAEVPIYFLDPHHKLGATVNFSGKSAAAGPVTVRLQPCGAAKARLIDASGKPISAYRGAPLIRMVVTPPGPSPSRQLENEARLAADGASLVAIDSINYADGPVSDALGQIAFPALVPGATYRRTPSGTRGAPHSDDFTVKSGETLDLGDILIEKPQQ
jgi:RNA polymerase sigma factor (sigma-70 family)